MTERQGNSSQGENKQEKEQDQEHERAIMGRTWKENNKERERKGHAVNGKDKTEKCEEIK